MTHTINMLLSFFVGAYDGNVKKCKDRKIIIYEPEATEHKTVEISKKLSGFQFQLTAEISRKSIKVYIDY